MLGTVLVIVDTIIVVVVLVDVGVVIIMLSRFGAARRGYK